MKYLIVAQCGLGVNFLSTCIDKTMNCDTDFVPINDKNEYRSQNYYWFPTYHDSMDITATDIDENANIYAGHSLNKIMLEIKNLDRLLFIVDDIDLFSIGPTLTRIKSGANDIKDIIDFDELTRFKIPPYIKLLLHTPSEESIRTAAEYLNKVKYTGKSIFHAFASFLDINPNASPDDFLNNILLVDKMPQKNICSDITVEEFDCEVYQRGYYDFYINLNVPFFMEPFIDNIYEYSKTNIQIITEVLHAFGNLTTIEKYTAFLKKALIDIEKAYQNKLI